jgi:hypothetical protein
MADNGRVAPSRPLPLLAVLSAVLAVGLGGLTAPSAAVAKAKLKPKIGWGPMKDRKAARKVQKTAHEPKPQNTEENQRVPTKAELKLFHERSGDPLGTQWMPYGKYVTGHYRGTTDDIIEWAAYKWGLPEDLLRAVAVKESTWDMDQLGDWDGERYDSFGIFQVRRPYHCCLPFSRDSTAFNADYYGAIIRAYYDGKQTWLNDPDIAPDNGQKYKAGDLWGSVGAWYSGRWHTEDSELNYVAPIKEIMRVRTWETDPNFDEG